MMLTQKRISLKVNVFKPKSKQIPLLAITQEWMTIKETTVSLKFAVQIMASLNNHVFTLGWEISQ